MRDFGTTSYVTGQAAAWCFSFMYKPARSNYYGTKGGKNLKCFQSSWHTVTSKKVNIFMTRTRLQSVSRQIIMIKYSNLTNLCPGIILILKAQASETSGLLKEALQVPGTETKGVRCPHPPKTSTPPTRGSHRRNVRLGSSYGPRSLHPHPLYTSQNGVGRRGSSGRRSQGVAWKKMHMRV